MELWELAARESIRDTIAGYTYYADRGMWDHLLAMFADDGVLEVEGEPPQAGRAALDAFFRGVNRDLRDSDTVSMRHHVSSVRIDVRSPTEASASAYFLVVTDAGVDHWGRYRDRLVPSGNRWVFAHRFVRTDGRVPGGWADRRQE